MFILSKAGVFFVCEQQHMGSIRSIRDASLGIPWIGSGAAEKAAFMLVREVSVREDMMMPGQEMLLLFLFIRRELSRDLNKRYS
jgi:hypothetical protein